MRHALLVVVLLTSFLMGSQWVFASTIYVREAVGTAVSADEKNVVRELIQAAIPSVKGATLVTKPDGAQITLEPRLIKLGSAYLLTINKVKGDSVTFSRQMRSQTFEDMDTVVARLTPAVINETEPQNEIKVSDVTEDEVKRGTRRRDTTRQWELSFGPGGISDSSAGNGTAWRLGFIFGLDAENELEIAYTGVSGRHSDARFWNFGIDYAYNFSEGNTSPFVGGSFGYAGAEPANSTTAFEDDVNGFTVGAAAGVKFFRTSKVNLIIAARGYKIFGEKPKAGLLTVGLAW